MGIIGLINRMRMDAENSNISDIQEFYNTPKLDYISSLRYLVFMKKHYMTMCRLSILDPWEYLADAEYKFITAAVEKYPDSYEINIVNRLVYFKFYLNTKKTNNNEPHEISILLANPDYAEPSYIFFVNGCSEISCCVDIYGNPLSMHGVISRLNKKFDEQNDSEFLVKYFLITGRELK